MSHVTDMAGGYVTQAGLYRVPDLVTAEQMVQYMWDTYQVKIKFVHEEDIDGNVNKDLEKQIKKEEESFKDKLLAQFTKDKEAEAAEIKAAEKKK